MRFVQSSFRRTKIVAVSTGLTAATIIVPAPHPDPKKVEAPKVPPRAGRAISIATHSVAAATSAPQANARFSQVIPARVPRARPGRVLTTASLAQRPPVSPPAIAVAARSSGLRIVPRPVALAAHPSDPMARPRPPRVNRVVLNRLAALCAVTQGRIITGAAEPSSAAASHAVRPALPRGPAARGVALHSLLVNGSNAPPRPQASRPAGPPRTAPRIIQHRTRGTQLFVPADTTIIVSAPARSRRAGQVLALHPTPPPPVRPTFAVAGRPLPRRAAQVLALRAVGPLQPPASQLGTHAGHTLKSRPVPRRAGQVLALSSPGIVWPTPSPHLVPAARRAKVRVASSWTLDPPPVWHPAPQVLAVAPVRRGQLAGVVARHRTRAAPAVNMGPLPQTTAVAIGRAPRRTAPQPVTLIGAYLAAPVDLFDAVLQRLRAWPGLAAAFGDSSATLKFWNEAVGRDTGPPYMSIAEIGDSGSYESNAGQGVPELDEGTFQLGITTAAGKTSARQLRKLVEAALDDAPLVFVGGEVIYLRHGKRFSQPISESGIAAGAAPARLVVEFVYKVEATLSST